jgi:3-methyladenine DNA glycosylase AlkD
MSRVEDEYVQMMAELEQLADPAWTAKLAHFGSRPGKSLGVPVSAIRALAKGRKCHDLAALLWQSGVHEARMLASMVEDPKQVSPQQMDAWTRDFDAWDLCDGVCVNVYWKTPYAREKALEWAGAEEEYVRRAGFVLMAVLAVHEKKAGDDFFEPFFPLILKHAGDNRNFVKKAVNWALRQIGKRKGSPMLRAKAITCAEEMLRMDAPAARWIAGDALKELRSR